MKARNIYINTLFLAIKDDRLAPAERLHRVKASIEAITEIEAIPEVQFIYAKFKRKNPMLSMEPDTIDVNIRDVDGETPLTLAAKQGYTEVVQALLIAKADPDFPNSYCRTALNCVCQFGHVEVVQTLLEAKANPDLPDKWGDTALLWAAFKGYPEIIELLIRQGRANIELTGLTKQTALNDAINREKLSEIYVLLSHGALIKNYENLFRFLMKCDQRDFQVLNSLQFLSEQLKNHIKSKDQHLVGLLNEAEQYLKKLNDLTQIHRKNNLEIIDTATNKVMPRVLVDMIAQYDAPLQDRILFFKPEEIDNQFMPAIKEQETKKPYLQRLLGR